MAQVEAADLVAAGAAPGAELEAALAKLVEHRHPLGETYGMVDAGLRLKMPEPTWMRSVLASSQAAIVALSDMCEYSSRKWCSVVQMYLKLFRSAA